MAMNRALPAVVITAIGIGALASFKSTTGLATKSAAAVVVPRTTVPASTAPPRRTTTPGPTTPQTVAPVGPPTTVAQAQTITGDPIDNQYGTVQVQITLQGSQITGITALQMPDSHQRSVEISQQVEPILSQEVLQAQSAQIDLVSGATFTSESYAQSLQAALDRSHG